MQNNYSWFSSQSEIEKTREETRGGVAVRRGLWTALIPDVRSQLPDCAPQTVLLAPTTLPELLFEYRTQIQAPRMSYVKLRKASFNHVVNKKHMKVLKLLRVPRTQPPFNEQEASLQAGILSPLISNYKKNLHKHSVRFQDWAYKSNSSILQLFKINIHFAFLVD